jgi:hypothetical protein
MRVNHASDIVPGTVNRAVNHIPCFVDAVVQLAKIRLTQNVSIYVDFDEAGGRDLFIEHSVGVDQESALLIGHRCGDVVGHHVRHLIVRNQPIARREIDPGFPLHCRHLVFHGRQGPRGRVRHEKSFRLHRISALLDERLSHTTLSENLRCLAAEVAGQTAPPVSAATFGDALRAGLRSGSRSQPITLVQKTGARSTTTLKEAGIKH